MALDGGSMKKKVLIKGPILTRSGYGEQTRFLLRSLRSREDLFDLYVQPLEWGNTSWISEVDEEREWIDNTVEKTIGFLQKQNTFDASIQVTIPNEWERLAPVNIGYTAGIETNRVAHEWLFKANEMDKLIVISEHAKRGFVETKYSATDQQTNQQVVIELNKPIDVVNYPVRKFPDSEPVELNLDYDFNFLCVAQMGPRKNIINTIKWFVEEFRNEEVGLVVKTNMSKNCLGDRITLMHNFKGLLDSLGDRKCKVYLLHGDMTNSEIHSLYTHPKISSFVLFTHGEGYGLPTFEAIYSGLPVVTTGWSGQLDFLVDPETGKDMFYHVSYDIQPVQQEVVWDGVIIKNSMWAFPREASAKHQMRRCFEHLTESKSSKKKTLQKFKDYADNVSERFSSEKLYEKMLNSVCDALNIDPNETNEQEILSF